MLATGTMGLGVRSVSGRRRVPSPPASMKAFMKFYSLRLRIITGKPEGFYFRSIPPGNLTLRISEFNPVAQGPRRSSWPVGEDVGKRQDESCECAGSRQRFASLWLDAAQAPWGQPWAPTLCERWHQAGARQSL